MSEGNGVTRRTLTHTAWTTPVLLMLPLARASAASCQSLPSVAFQGVWGAPSVSTGWAASAGGPLGFMPLPGGTGFGAVRDTTLGTAPATVETSVTLVLEKNTTYTMTFPIETWFTANALTATLTISGGGTTYTRTTASGSPGTVRYTFTTGSSASVTINVGVSVARSLVSTTGDDIVLRSPTLVCGTAAAGAAAPRRETVPEASRTPAPSTSSGKDAKAPSPARTSDTATAE